MTLNELKTLLDIELRNPFVMGLQAEQQENAEKFRNLNETEGIGDILSLIPKAQRAELNLKLILAIGYFKLRQETIPPSKLFDSKPLGYILSSDYLNSVNLIHSLVYAAGNFFNQMQKVAGDSEEIWKVKEQVWNACFGKSLYHAIFIKNLIRKQTIMFLGETGTGKELFADCILDADYTGKPQANPASKSGFNPAKRNNKIKRNIAALPATLIESELFGHTADAFTGAKKDRDGAFKIADKGIIFLDEIGDMPIDQQAKVLRVVEYGDYYKLGAIKPTKVNVRIVTATNQNVYDEKRFRPELFERLSGNLIDIPPLRERTGDIKVIGNLLYKKWVKGELANKKWDYLGKGYEKYLKKLSGLIYEWPGNVRELEKYIKRYFIGREEVPTKMVGISVKPDDTSIPDELKNLTWTWKQLRRWYALEVLEKFTGTKSKALLSLGASRNSLAEWTKSNEK